MAYADYEHCPGCDAKTIYMGERDTMDSDQMGIVVCWHQGCLDAEIAKRVAAERERARFVFVWRDERGAEICRSSALAVGAEHIGIPLDAQHADLLREVPGG